MKNIKSKFPKFVLAFAILIVVYSGCAKLDEKPLSSIAPETYYTNVAQCESVLAASMARLYSEWADASYGYGWNNFKLDDQLDGGDININTNHASGLFASHWMAIQNLNTLIKQVNKGTVIASPEELNLLVGQAKLIRGWNYFQIVRLWGGMPLYTELNESGSTLDLPRSSVAETYDLIISDFKYAAENLPATWPTDKQGRPTKATAQGLMAKAYLTMATNPLNAIENYAKARDEAKLVMTDGIHGLVEPVATVFDRVNKYSKEMIWSFIANSADPTGHAQIWDTEKGWGDNAIDVRMDSVWPSQPRKTAYLRTVNAAGKNYLEWGGTNRPSVQKWIRPAVTDDEWASGKVATNIPILRFADVLLIYAEASNMASPGANAPQDACDAINQVIDRANGGTGVINPDPRASRATTAWTKAEFDKRVIQERNFEFIGEYDRLFDLIRKRMLNDPEVHPSYNGYSILERDYLWPFPDNDIELNPLLKQNPGY